MQRLVLNTREDRIDVAGAMKNADELDLGWITQRAVEKYVAISDK
jgi:hypothetical protein